MPVVETASDGSLPSVLPGMVVGPVKLGPAVGADDGVPAGQPPTFTSEPKPVFGARSAFAV